MTVLWDNASGAGFRTGMWPTTGKPSRLRISLGDRKLLSEMSTRKAQPNPSTKPMNSAPPIVKRILFVANSPRSGGARMCVS